MSDDALLSYRLYFFDGGHHVNGAHDVQARDDEQATAAVQVLADACSDRHPGLELWRAGSLIASAGKIEADFVYEQLEAALQDRVAEWEEILMDVREELKRSAKLCERCAQLRELGRARRGD